MKRRGWWIAGGILLLWISPLIWALAKPSLYPERQDQSKNWADWHKAERQRKRNQIMAEWKGIVGYQPVRTSYSSPKESGSGEREVEVVYVDLPYRDWETDRKSTRLNSSHSAKSRMPSSA